jgi:hypothetical protein
MCAMACWESGTCARPFETLNKYNSKMRSLCFSQRIQESELFPKKFPVGMDLNGAHGTVYTEILRLDTALQQKGSQINTIDN